MSQPSGSVEPRGFAGAAAGLGGRHGVCRCIRGGCLGAGRDLWGVEGEAAFAQELLQGGAGNKPGAAEFDRGDAAAVAELQAIRPGVDGIGDALGAPTQKMGDL